MPLRDSITFGVRFLLSLAILSGCGRTSSIDDTYGRRAGSRGGASVNGTGVLSQMYRQAGYRVATARRLSSTLERADVIVWAPDDFRSPRAEQRRFLEDWLWQQDGRTLVFIGRDFDAATLYWARIMPSAPPEQAIEIRRRWAAKRSEHDRARERMPTDEDFQWFVSRRDGKPRAVHSLQGRWSRGINASDVEIQLQGRFESKESSSSDAEEDWDSTLEAAVLLASDGDAIVSSVHRRHWVDSKIILVTNGSFLLNVPLANHEHRKLAGRLINECGPPGRVVFVESSSGGPPISERSAEIHHFLRAFTVWPVSCILLHLTLLGAVFCVSVFPIFGRPRDLPPEPLSDFGMHVDALASLLEKTADTGYATARLIHYQQTVRTDSTRGTGSS